MSDDPATTENIRPPPQEAPATPSASITDSTPPPKSPPATFPIVGIGASAGGLAAFEAFFSAMSADTRPDMAFVLVQHLSPNHKSMLTELVQRYTPMQVFEVTDGLRVQPNCAYIIPPGFDMAFIDGALHLLEPVTARGQRMPIDFFFRSLAQDQHERAIGIILSGTGSDGTLGIRAIKGEGGMVMVQNPASTEYDGMSRSALATGLVDYELPPAEMPVQLMAYVAQAIGRPPRPMATVPSQGEIILKKIFILLRVQTGHDFSQYKLSTIQRRIQRRMAVHQIDTSEGYVRFLQQTPIEVEALFRDLLIGVTGFFRDPEAFQALEAQVLPQLFGNLPAEGVIRVWVPGCSSGEEAYSLAILLIEQQERLKQNYKMQIFATDIDSKAIAIARNGLYPASIAADLTPERRARYFVAEPETGGWRIHKHIRDLLVFSEQNMVRDPPFSRLDLISCRNLLIYMNADLQKKLIPLFHYALNPGGFLFLGTSESIGDFNSLFTVMDRKFKLYQRRDGFGSPSIPLPGGFANVADCSCSTAPPVPLSPNRSTPRTVQHLTEQALLHQVAPAALLVNRNGDILYIHGRTGLFLEPASGASGVSNIFKMAREGLRQALTTVLHKSTTSRETIRCTGVRVKTNGGIREVTLTARVVLTSLAQSFETPLYLITLEQTPFFDSSGKGPRTASASRAPAAVTAQAFPVEPVSEAETPLAPADDTAERITALEQELRAKEEYLQSALEELETSNEELKSSNEEMQSMNEELQSANEELETSKEELQSVNEELATVNAELQDKVASLSQANNDLNNLLAGTGVGTLFVDFELRIVRFTPAATQVINLIPTDIGRPVGHIVSNLPGYDNLVADTRAVLDSLVPKEVEVQSQTGDWYLMHIRPYRTLNNVIEGAVLTFVNITRFKQIALQI